MSEVLGIEKVLKNLQKEIELMPTATMKGLIRGGIEVLRKAKTYAPIDLGNLRGSAYMVTSKGELKEGQSPSFKGRQASKMKGDHDRVVQSMKGQISGVIMKPTVAIGFSAEYALKVHENPRAGKTGGVSPSGQVYKHWAKSGVWKYLEKAFKESTPHILEMIKKEAKR